MLLEIDKVKSVFLCILIMLFSYQSYSQTTRKALEAKELQKFLPSSIKGFSMDGKPESSSMSINGVTISSAEVNFASGEQYIKITLVDYGESANLFLMATQAWTMNISIENDEQKSSTFSLKGGKVNGWEVFYKEDNRAEVFLGINGRFYLSIVAENQTGIELAKSIAEGMNLDGLLSQ